MITSSEQASLDRVADAGRLLYGDRWLSALARDLDVNLRTMQNWFAAPTSSTRRAMPPAILAEVEKLMRERRDAVDGWLADQVEPLNGG